MGSAANATRTPIRTPLVGSAGRKAPLNAWRTAQITRRGTLRQSRLSARAPLVPPVSMRSAQMPPQGNAYLSRLFERGDYLCHRETTLPEGARTSWHGATVVAAYFRMPPEENGPSPREHNPERASQRRPQSLR